METTSSSAKLSWKTILVAVAIAALLVTAVTMSNPITAPTFEYPGDFNAHFVVFDYGGTVYAKNAWTGEILLSSATTNNTDYVVNMALGNLTSGRAYSESVFMVGNLTGDDPIQLPSYAELLISGSYTLAAGSDCNMIENADQSGGNTWMTIRGVEGRAILDHDRANQATGDIIHIDNNNQQQDPSMDIHLFNLELRRADVCAVNITLHSADNFYIQNVHIKEAYDPYGAGFFLFASDSWLVDCSVNAAGPNLQWGKSDAYCGDIFIQNFYAGGSASTVTDAQVVLVGVRRGMITNLIVDNSAGHGLIMSNGGGGADGYCTDITFLGCEVHSESLGSDNTYDAVRFGGNTRYCRWIGGYIGRKDQETPLTNDWRYGFVEDASADYNIISGTRLSDDFDTGDFSLQGTSRIVDSWNVTTWISEST